MAEGFERIHRTNLIGMGVLPLEFKPGVNRKTLSLDGTETYDVIGERKPRADLTLVIHRANGETVQSRGDLPPGHGRGSLHLRSRRRAAALRPGLPGSRIGRRGQAGRLRPGHGWRAPDPGAPASPINPTDPEDRDMAHAPQTKIAATYMRGGTSKGVFFKLDDLPEPARAPGAARDALLMRVIGSPDPYGKQIDGMGAATSSTSKTVIIGKEQPPRP